MSQDPNVWVLVECYSTQAGQLCADEQRCTLMHRDAQGEKPLTRSITVLTFLLFQQTTVFMICIVTIQQTTH